MDLNMPSSYEPYSHHGLTRGHADHDHGEKLIAASSDAETLLQHRSPPRHVQKRQRPSIFQTIRLVMRGIELLMDIATLAMMSHAAITWWKTRDTMVNNDDGFREVQWPHTNMWPTWTMLGIAALTTLFHLISFLSYLRKVRSMRQSAWHSRAVYLKSFLVAGGWTAATVYFKMSSDRGRKTRHWDLWSWTCHVKDESGDIPWNALCTEMNVTFIGCVTAVPLEVLGLIIFIFTYQRSKTRGKYQRARSAEMS